MMKIAPLGMDAAPSAEDLNPSAMPPVYDDHHPTS
jgi:hypothetical protein